MIIRSLQLTDWRSYESAELELADGFTAVVGPNGQGKTNLLEAIGWLAGIGSFRGAPDDALIRLDAQSAILRAAVVSPDGRNQLIEAEVRRTGPNRIQLNGQRLGRTGDIREVLQVTVFSPDDLELVKGGPALRRAWIDETLANRHRKFAALLRDLARILKQRNALLRSVAGRLDADAEFTLDVWDAKLAGVGSEVRSARVELLTEMTPHLLEAYRAVARRPEEVTAHYESSWVGDLGEALAASRSMDLRRGVSTVGPHRDEIDLSIGVGHARTHASQGEQRSLALSLRLGADAVLRASGTGQPVLLLDDVFSELDPGRAGALLDALPSAQRILTTAAGLPPAAQPDQVLEVIDGKIRAQRC